MRSSFDQLPVKRGRKPKQGITKKESARNRALIFTEPLILDFITWARSQNFKFNNEEYYFTLTQGEFVVVYSRASLEFQAYFKGAGDYSWETGRESLETVDQIIQWVTEAKEEMKDLPRKVVVDEDNEDYEDD